eukprot:TRINITY_DN7636_c0_g1_i1.p1 TRINITY_DN7636_c0_g1~~TRINITY_DN7636_c0_g1_i1.p1  ORF type:complete len:642 (-),score=152.69 TRINITY_DN7636_c0_g1_i1:42-1967(-)
MFKVTSVTPGKPRGNMAISSSATLAPLGKGTSSPQLRPDIMRTAQPPLLNQNEGEYSFQDSTRKKWTYKSGFSEREGETSEPGTRQEKSKSRRHLLTNRASMRFTLEEDKSRNFDISESEDVYSKQHSAPFTQTPPRSSESTTHVNSQTIKKAQELLVIHFGDGSMKTLIIKEDMKKYSFGELLKKYCAHRLYTLDDVELVDSALGQPIPFSLTLKNYPVKEVFLQDTGPPPPGYVPPPPVELISFAKPDRDELVSQFEKSEEPEIIIAPESILPIEDPLFSHNSISQIEKWSFVPFSNQKLALLKANTILHWQAKEDWGFVRGSAPVSFSDGSVSHFFEVQKIGGASQEIRIGITHPSLLSLLAMPSSNSRCISKTAIRRLRNAKNFSPTKYILVKVRPPLCEKDVIGVVVTGKKLAVYKNYKIVSLKDINHSFFNDEETFPLISFSGDIQLRITPSPDLTQYPPSLTFSHPPRPQMEPYYIKNLEDLLGPFKINKLRPKFSNYTHETLTQKVLLEMDIPTHLKQLLWRNLEYLRDGALPAPLQMDTLIPFEDPRISLNIGEGKGEGMEVPPSDTVPLYSEGVCPRPAPGVASLENETKPTLSSSNSESADMPSSNDISPVSSQTPWACHDTKSPSQTLL